jgi:hypothetical protein
MRAKFFLTHVSYAAPNFWVRCFEKKIDVMDGYQKSPRLKFGGYKTLDSLIASF